MVSFLERSEGGATRKRLISSLFGSRGFAGSPTGGYTGRFRGRGFQLRLESLKPRVLLATDVLSDLETQAVDVVAAQVAADHVDLQGSAALAADVNGDNLLQPIDVLLIINAVSADGQISLMPGDPMDVNVDCWLMRAKRWHTLRPPCRLQADRYNN